MNGILETITNCMAASFWAAPLLALVAGIITSFTPCSLATVPMLQAPGRHLGFLLLWLQVWQLLLAYLVL